MTAYIGDVEFPDGLMWINKNQPVTLGSVTQTMGGVVIISGTGSQDYKHAICDFDYIPWSSVETLRYYMQTQEVYEADLEGTGDVVNVQFHPTKGVEEDSIESRFWGKRIVHARLQDALGASYRNDKYKGRLNLIIVPA